MLADKIIIKLMSKVTLELECRNSQKAQETLQFLLDFYNDQFEYDNTTGGSKKMLQQYHKMIVNKI